MAKMRFFVRNIEKILEKVCRYENNAYLCIRNQEISSYKTKQQVESRKIQNRFKKKLKKKVCKKFLKNLVVKKKGLTFAPLSASK